MKRTSLYRTALFLTVSIGWFATSVAAQTKPDFSGRWTNEAAAQANTAQRGGQGGARRQGGNRQQRGTRGQQRGTRGQQRGTRGQQGGTRSQQRGQQRGQQRSARQGGTRQRGGRQRSGEMGSGWGNTLTVTQDVEQLSVQYTFFSRGDLQPALKFTYALDGSESKNSVQMGRGIQVQLSKTAWDADELAITTVHFFPNPTTGESVPYEITQTLSLESPTSMVVETTRSGLLGGKPSTTRTVYTKR